jgi:lysozyme family protein
MDLTAGLKRDYNELFSTCKASPFRLRSVDALVDSIASGRRRLEAMGTTFGIPWYVLGIIQMLEGGGSFSRHLHNGDPLTARTKNVPKGRPSAGRPPFTWEQSAKDAIELEHLDTWKDWSVAGILFRFEAFNGFGYRKRTINIPSPYLWSFSNHYRKGKFDRDGHYDPNLVSEQCGAAVLLHRMIERGLAAQTASTGATRVLRRGSSGADVRDLKKKLRKWFDRHAPGDWAGFGVVDNDLFGRALESAVKEFQRRNSIAATGRVGKETLRTLGMK